MPEIPRTPQELGAEAAAQQGESALAQAGLAAAKLITETPISTKGHQSGYRRRSQAPNSPEERFYEVVVNMQAAGHSPEQIAEVISRIIGKA